MTELRRLKIKNFKSLKDVDIEFDHLNILIGMNGAGKSTVLQALDFVSQLMCGEINTWLKNRDWSAADLNCKLSKESNIEIEVWVRLDSGIDLLWEAHFNRRKLNCTTERFSQNNTSLMRVRSGNFSLDDNPFKEIPMEYQGSALAHLRKGFSEEHWNYLTEFRKFFLDIQSLELLSPNLMRKRARYTNNDIGAGGEKLSAFLSSLKGDTRDRLLEMLKLFYPRTINFKISNLAAGWKKLTLIEQFGDQLLETEARHINDGLLRILAILAQTQTAPSMLLLDEIENGVNQELVEKLVNVLLAAQTQLVVTTHSPLILNYLPDDVAKKSVQFIYKSPEGATQIRRFFDIPRIADKLELMGAGDAFVDTNLIDLAQECHLLDALGYPAQ